MDGLKGLKMQAKDLVRCILMNSITLGLVAPSILNLSSPYSLNLDAFQWRFKDHESVNGASRTYCSIISTNSRLGDRTCAAAGPQLSNSLPVHIRQPVF